MKRIVIIFMCLLSSVYGQVNVLGVKLKISKSQFIASEHVYADVLITNRGGRPVVLADNAGIWLDFEINRNGGKNVAKVGKAGFAGVRIPAGQAITRRVVLTTVFPLATPGNYTIRAIVTPPAAVGVPVKSGPAFFDVNNGVVKYKMQHGVRAKGGKVVEYRILLLNKVGGNELYFQSYDPKKNQIHVTYSLGKYVGVHQPQYKVDAAGLMHVLFQVGAKIYRYLQIADTGVIIKQELIKQAVRGTPMLVSLPNGAIDYRNGLAFDAKEEAKKRASIHNLSQRPPFAY